MADYCSHSGKQIHANSDKAMKAVRRLEQGFPYLCPYCGGWHHARQSEEKLKLKQHKHRVNIPRK